MNLNKILKLQKDNYIKNGSITIDQRLELLSKLKILVKQNEKNILQALYHDLGKSDFEGYITEVQLVLEEIDYIYKNLKKWLKPKKVSSPILHFPAKSMTLYSPLGQTLIISPWNYPFQLALVPLIGAIAAGNTCIIKPSRNSKHTSKLLFDLINNNFDSKYIYVIDPDEISNEELLNEKYNHIFFTGSSKAGREVMAAAAKKLTKVTLELGGKSPVIVDKTADIDLTAKRIIWGKLLNSGQTCVAPDYFLVHKEVEKNLLNKLKKWIEEFYGTNPIDSDDYTKIINEKSFSRLEKLIDIEKENILVKYPSSKDQLKMGPVILQNVSFQDEIMKEEIFGPILPVISYENTDEIIYRLNSRPSPLALYLFTKDKKIEDKVLNEISFGGSTVNDVIVHLASNKLPFGGVGESGQGAYHGKASLDVFSHKKSIMKRKFYMDINVKYAPFKDKIKIIKKLLRI